MHALVLASERVLKTLIVRLPSSGCMVCVVPVSSQLDLRACAAAVDLKKASMAEAVEAERVTGHR